MATHDITNKLSNLNLSFEQYTGSETIQVGDGMGLPMHNHSESSLSTSSSPFLLRNLLHVPSITKNLVSVLYFCIDNNCFFEFPSSHVFINDSLTKKTLLTGPTRDDLYLFPIHNTSFPTVNVSETTSLAQWRCWMGHPSLALVNHVLRIVFVFQPYSGCFQMSRMSAGKVSPFIFFS